MSQRPALEPDRQRRKLKRSPLLQRHPVLMPFLLLGGAALLGIASMQVDDVFPALAFIGVPSTPLCLLLALVLATSGVLVGIISIIEHVDQSCIPDAMFPQSKEHGYDSH